MVDLLADLTAVEQSIDLALESFAVFDKRFKDEKGQYLYRYSLVRRWPTRIGPKIVFLMLNPSRADAIRNDNTVSKCMVWAQQWGFRTLEVVNLFAFRSPDPKTMKAQQDPIGPLNDYFITEACGSAERIVCAWGRDGKHLDRAGFVVKKLLSERKLWAFRVGRTGQPDHPLYKKRTAELVPFTLN